MAVGDLLDLGPSLQVEVLHAWAGDSNENNNSVVLRVVHGEVRVLLGGDCEHYGCEDQFSPGPIDIYKVHHHGSSGASSQELLQEMMPGIALISAGLDNSYGHPHLETLRRLAAIGAFVHRTDQDGTGVVRSDGERWWPVPLEP